MHDDLTLRAQKIELLALDADGVLSDASLIYSGDGVESKAFNARDGLGLRLLRGAGVEVAIISGRESLALTRRAQDLGLSLLFQGVKDKVEVLRGLLAARGLSWAQAAYMGDDLIDLGCLARAGLAICPRDAVLEARRTAHLVTEAPGGRGAVRQACEFILQSKGLWEEILARCRGA
jgi:3-deoxy-D-manno-octulosonate 8-phosphate phosphatase (KDO 8-P phosphatase)